MYRYPYLSVTGWAYGYYVFGVLELGYTFEMNSAWQQIDVLMSSINSSANPLLYFLLMPRFRVTLINIFFPCDFIKNRVSPDESNTADSSSTKDTSVPA